EKAGALPTEAPVATDGGIAIFTDAGNAAALRGTGAKDDLSSWVKAQLGRIKAGDYVALLAYIDRSPPHLAALQAMRMAI
ncbi:UNVERIFIED_CONTAM: hypothetical protein NY603_39420, partial [Bacteroidetes bacterium 56_B9]